jgi:ubiquinone biosynthesis protein
MTGFIPGPKDKKRIRKTGIDRAQFARETLEKLGSTFIKFGQFLSIRPDLIPAEVCNEFRSLQDKVPTFPFDQVREILDTEFKAKHTEVFSEFDEVSVASASVSQVHRARLLSGEEVAVKVQRPGIREEMEADTIIMAFLANLVERFVPRLRKNRPRMLVEEFSKWTERELDFHQEAKNAAHFHFHFKDDIGVKFPEVYLELTTEKILVMEFIKGTNLLEAQEEAMDKQAVVRRIAETMLKQIFKDGFFHGDPHPGNIFLLKRDAIAYLDFGIVGYLTKELREWSFDCLFGMAEGDINRVIESFIELCNVNEEEVDVQAYRRRIHEVLGDIHVCEVCEIPFSSILEKFLNTSLDCGLNVPADVVIMSKAIATLEGTCLSFAPEIRITDLPKAPLRLHLNHLFALTNRQLLDSLN